MGIALLIVDVQRAFFDEEPRPYEANAVVQRINELSSRARALGRPVVFIQHERASANIKYGSERWQLQCDLLIAPNDHFVRKTTPDSFLRTPLQELLDSLDVKQVVICGCDSEFCVDTTTRRAAALGYAVTLAADAHTTHDKEHASAFAIRAHHNATLPNMVSFGVSIQAIPSVDISFAA